MAGFAEPRGRIARQFATSIAKLREAAVLFP
jgi:hypothetical protein